MKIYNSLTRKKEELVPLKEEDITDPVVKHQVGGGK